MIIMIINMMKNDDHFMIINMMKHDDEVLCLWKNYQVTQGRFEVTKVEGWHQEEQIV